MNKRAVGNLGEDAACDALRREGCEILARNFRRPTGEIDVVARDRKTVVFVEVKKRSSTRYGSPAEAVNEAKRRRIMRTAALYLAENRLDDAPVRFDIVEVLPGELRHLRAAFDATDVSEF